MGDDQFPQSTALHAQVDWNLSDFDDDGLGQGEIIQTLI